MATPKFRETQRIELVDDHYGRISNVEVRREDGREQAFYSVAVWKKGNPVSIAYLAGWSEKGLLKYVETGQQKAA